MATEHDSGYKFLFSTPELVRDLILGFVPDEWLHSLDYARWRSSPEERKKGKKGARLNFLQGHHAKAPAPQVECADGNRTRQRLQIPLLDAGTGARPDPRLCAGRMAGFVPDEWLHSLDYARWRSSPAATSPRISANVPTTSSGG